MSSSTGWNSPRSWPSCCSGFLTRSELHTAFGLPRRRIHTLPQGLSSDGVYPRTLSLTYDQKLVTKLSSNFEPYKPDKAILLYLNQHTRQLGLDAPSFANPKDKQSSSDKSERKQSDNSDKKRKYKSDRFDKKRKRTDASESKSKSSSDSRSKSRSGFKASLVVQSTIANAREKSLPANNAAA